MSYISTIRHTGLSDAAWPRPAHAAAVRPPRAWLPSVTARVSGGLEVGLLLFIMSGLSLVMCTIAAGAL